MAFVLGHEVPDGHAALLQGGHHLLGLGPRDAWVVHPLDDEQGLRDLVDVVERGGALHPRPHGGIALVAVLDAPQVLAVPGRVLEEGRKVRDPDDVHRAADPAVVAGRRHEGHVAAIAPARHEHVAGVEVGPPPDPIEQRADVPIRARAQHAVVALRECLAVAGGAADVREDESDAELVHQVVVAPEETGPRLTLGSAVDVDDHGPRPAEPCRWLVEEPRDRAAVEAPPVDQLGVHEGVGVDPPGLTASPADEAAGREIE